MTLLPWLLAVVPLLGLPRVASTVTVSDTSALYVRGDFKLDRSTLGIENAPRLNLDFDARRLRLSLGYGPRVVLADLTNTPSILLLHEGAAALRYGTPRLTLAAGHAFTIGEQYLGKLPTVVPDDPIAEPSSTEARITPLANGDSLRIRAHTSGASAAYAWTRRAQSELRGSYSVSGGASSSARAILPSQKTISVETDTRMRVARTHTLATGVTLARVTTSNDYEHYIGTLSESWAVRFTRRTNGSLSAGAALRESERPDGTHERGVAPAVAASVNHELRVANSRGALQGGGSLAPFVNYLTGELQLAAQGSLGASVRNKRGVVELAFDALQTLPADALRATRLIGGGLRATESLKPWVSLFASLRIQHQDVEDTALSLAMQWAVGVGCTFVVPPLRL